MKDKTVLVGGYAKLPAGITAGELYDVVCIGAELDLCTGTIVDADCTLATRTAKEFFLRIIVGRSLEDMVHLEREISQRYHGNAQKALIVALKCIHKKYLDLKAKFSETD